MNFVFESGNNKLKEFNVPKLKENDPHSLFTHAIGPESLKFNRRLDRVHRAQQLLLDSLYLFYQTHPKLPRPYLHNVPADEAAALNCCFSEEVFFAAQVLAFGFHIDGLEAHSAQLYPSAYVLVCRFEALRYVFTDKIDLCVLRDFEVAWIAFEEALTVLYFANSDGRSDEAEWMEYLLNESIDYALKEGLLDATNVKEVDPNCIFAIPRIMFVVATREIQNCIDLSHPTEGLKWFISKRSIVLDLQEQLRGMSKESVRHLLHKLSSGTEEEEQYDAVEESLGKIIPRIRTTSIRISVSQPDPGLGLYRGICLVADEIQSGRYAKHFNEILAKVFQSFE